MKKSISILTATFLLLSISANAQSTMKDYKAGHEFHVSLPDYMSRTVGQNDAAVIQFKNVVKDIAGFIIDDSKEELEIAEVKFSSINEFYDDFIKTFLLKEKKRTISQPVYQTIGDINFAECDATCYDKETKSDLYYFVGIVETKTSFYKLLCYGNIDCKDKYKADFQKILYSFRE